VRDDNDDATVAAKGWCTPKLRVLAKKRETRMPHKTKYRFDIMLKNANVLGLILVDRQWLCHSTEASSMYVCCWIDFLCDFDWWWPWQI